MIALQVLPGRLNGAWHFRLLDSTKTIIATGAVTYSKLPALVGMVMKMNRQRHRATAHEQGSQ